MKKVLTYVLAAMAALLTGDTALYCGYLIIASVLYAAFIFCLFGTARTLHRIDRMYADKEKRYRLALDNLSNEISELRLEMQTTYYPAAPKASKQNVRPGSRPSEKYKKLIGGEILDAGRKDQASEKKA